MNILFLGDIVGKPGRQVISKYVSILKERYEPDLIIANGENAAGGLGIDLRTADEIFKAGVEFITTGNHIWSKKDITKYLDSDKNIIRPSNYPKGAPGIGFKVITCKNGDKVGIANFIGRVFIPDLVDCPFKEADRVIEILSESCDYIFVDFHAEATSEKVAFAHYLDGRVSAVVGTHTHIQTADERILPGGTAFITDVGMCGPDNSVIGVSKELIVQRFVTARPSKFEIASGPCRVNAVFIKFDKSSKENNSANKFGNAISIERIFDIIEK